MTTSLEDERDRLKELIDFTEKRVKERNDFIDDYIKITANFLEDLPRVSNEDELDGYRDRLGNIDEYLSNCKEITKLNEKLVKKRAELEEKYDSKSSNEVINAKLEDELVECFNNITLKDDYYSNLNYTDIDNELVKAEVNLEDKKDVMDTFISSYDALKNAGISGTEREEYLSYVNDAKRDYYQELEKKYMLSIYKLVLDKTNDYDTLYQKRMQIDELLKDRLDNRKKLNIDSRDELEYFTKVCNEQFSIIKSQKINMENIDKLILEISECENKLEELDRANNRSEIVELLNEYSVDKPKVQKVDDIFMDDSYEPDNNTNEVKVAKANNMVVKVSEPVKINVKNATDTAKLVMKKVVIVLEPKKFNTKRDKLKEAEMELEEIKKKEALLENKEEKTDDMFMTMDTSNATDNVEDDVFISTPDSNVNIELDTQEVTKGVKETQTVDQVVLDAGGDTISIPTEIFVEETREKPVTLFSQTDPFLDDNQFEIENDYNYDESISDIPEIRNIGTVRPNSMLSQIEESQKETEDITLPTMGLTNEENKGVPIVSENYIN